MALVSRSAAISFFKACYQHTMGGCSCRAAVAVFDGIIEWLLQLILTGSTGATALLQHEIAAQLPR